MLQRWITARPQFESAHVATPATSATRADSEQARSGDVAEVARVAARVAAPALAQPLRLPLALVYPDGRRQWWVAGPAKGAQAITGDVQRLRAVLRGAGVELIADNRTLAIVAPSDWQGMEFQMLAANAGAILDLLHVESDRRMEKQAGSMPKQSEIVASD